MKIENLINLDNIKIMYSISFTIKFIINHNVFMKIENLILGFSILYIIQFIIKFNE